MGLTGDLSPVNPLEGKISAVGWTGLKEEGGKRQKEVQNEVEGSGLNNGKTWYHSQRS